MLETGKLNMVHRNMLLKMRAVIEALADDKHFEVSLVDLYNEELDLIFNMSDFRLREFARSCVHIDELLKYKQSPGGSYSVLYRCQKATDKPEDPAPLTQRVTKPRRASAGTKSYYQSPKWRPKFLTEQSAVSSDDYEDMVSRPESEQSMTIEVDIGNAAQAGSSRPSYLTPAQRFQN